jgi:hypothetical protein
MDFDILKRFSTNNDKKYLSSICTVEDGVIKIYNLPMICKDKKGLEGKWWMKPKEE